MKTKNLQVKTLFARKLLNCVASLRGPDGKCTTPARRTLELLLKTHCSDNDRKQGWLRIADLDPSLLISYFQKQGGLEITLASLNSPRAYEAFLVLLQKSPQSVISSSAELYTSYLGSQ